MPWQPDARSPQERGRVLANLQHLATTGRLALGRLGAAARSLVRSRTETRRILSEEVYRVPDPLLDDVIRVRLEDLGEKGDDHEHGDRAG